MLWRLRAARQRPGAGCLGWFGGPQGGQFHLVEQGSHACIFASHRVAAAAADALRQFAQCISVSSAYGLTGQTFAQFPQATADARTFAAVPAAADIGPTASLLPTAALTAGLLTTGLLATTTGLLQGTA